MIIHATERRTSERRTVPEPVLRNYDDAVDALESRQWRAGRAVLQTGWNALQRGKIECLNVVLRNGTKIDGVVELRIAGPIVEAATRRGAWNHAFTLDQVSLVRCIDFGFPH